MERICLKLKLQGQRIPDLQGVAKTLLTNNRDYQRTTKLLLRAISSSGTFEEANITERLHRRYH
jgi:hypothetical protein